MPQLRAVILYNNKYYCDLETHERLDRDRAIVSASFSKTTETFDGSLLSLETFNKIKAEDDWIIIKYYNQIYILAIVRYSLTEPDIWNICRNSYDIITNEFEVLVDCSNPKLAIEIENRKLKESNSKLKYANIDLQNQLNDAQLHNHKKESNDLVGATYQLKFCVLKYENGIPIDEITRTQKNIKQPGVATGVVAEVTTDKQLTIDQLGEYPFIKSIKIIPNYDYEKLENCKLSLHQEFKAMYKIFSKLIRIRYD